MNILRKRLGVMLKVWLLAIACCPPLASHAVLKEKDLAATLAVLRAELANT